MDLNYSHVVNLNGNATWSAGNGRLIVGSAYSQGSTSYPAAQLNIAAGTTFTDAGAASATGFKTLGLGGPVNNGTYRREGLGLTFIGGFRNAGLLDLAAGTVQVDAAFQNSGTVQIASGALLAATSGTFNNAGLMRGLGTVKTLNANTALTNAGTLDPGLGNAPGTLTIDGDLTFTDSAVLRIELGAAGASDRLVVTDQVLWNGTLALAAGEGFAPAVGESFLIASFAQRLSGSTFDTFTWSGAEGLVFALDYGSTDISVRVTAVPEPGAWMLMLTGVAALLLRVRRLPRAPTA
jgi:hypothetical protein